MQLTGGSQVPRLLPGHGGQKTPFRERTVGERNPRRCAGDTNRLPRREKNARPEGIRKEYQSTAGGGRIAGG